MLYDSKMMFCVVYQATFTNMDADAQNLVFKPSKKNWIQKKGFFNQTTLFYQMGNENSSSDSNTNKNKPVLNQKQKQKQKQTQNKLQHKSYDEFFINHHKLYSLSHTIDVSLINPKRIVFISIIGLYRSWKCCPSILLYNAIIITPLKKDWIMQPDAYRHEYNYMLQNEQFLTLLRWKEHQKLAIFLVDNDDDDDDINDGINSSNSSSSSSSLPSHSDSKETSSKKSETQSTLYG
eukprot:358147_1